jgi:phytoene dehydrogenase-like protein
VNGLVAGGREIKCGVVASGVDPNLTFQKFLTPGELPDEFRRQVRRINYDSASIKINLALKELPDFKAKPGKTPQPHHRGTIHICPDSQTIEEAYADSVAGRPSRTPVLEATIPSVVDPTVAPEGKHVMNIFVQYGPHTLRNGETWDTAKGPFLKRCIELMNSYAPNFADSILHSEILTPVDMEREWGLTGGNIFHGRLTLDQMFFMRPVPGYSDYRTPIRGLYVCGSAAHPGGGVMGTPGWNAARTILGDRIRS